MIRTMIVFVWLVTVASSVSAQNPYVLDFYGDGVHAFHRGEIARASQQFNKAIDNGSRDPRVFYYRALTHLQTGDVGSAEQDIRTGVTFELRGLGTYDIGRALERVQGPHRIEFEEKRLEVKLAMSGRALERPQPFQPFMDPSVIDARPLADDLPLDGGPAFGDDPFDDDQEDSSDATDLDLDDTMPGDDATEEAGPDDAPADRDEPAEEPSADEDPFGAEVDDDDPFGEPAAAPEDSPVEDDPFADDTVDADTVDEDDPFK